MNSSRARQMESPGIEGKIIRSDAQRAIEVETFLRNVKQYKENLETKTLLETDLEFKKICFTLLKDFNSPGKIPDAMLEMTEERNNYKPALVMAACELIYDEELIRNKKN